jgi:hypothetical protein
MSFPRGSVPSLHQYAYTTWYSVKRKHRDNFTIYLYFTFTLQEELEWLTGIKLGYGFVDRGFEPWQGLGIFPFTTASRPALGPTHPPIDCIPGVLS